MRAISGTQREPSAEVFHIGRAFEDVNTLVGAVVPFELSRPRAFPQAARSGLVVGRPEGIGTEYRRSRANPLYRHGIALEWNALASGDAVSIAQQTGPH